MKIACLGWGSLIWRPEGLLIRREWFADGALLPIEFVRKSDNKRLTLVITENAKPVRTLWALMATEDLEEAKKSLALREGIKEKNIPNSIDSVIVDTTVEFTGNKLIIQNWAKNLKLDAVIWTSLPAKFNKEKTEPTIIDAIAHLNSLTINERGIAEEYIRRAPKQIDTEFRRRFESEFGWTYIETKVN